MRCVNLVKRYAFDFNGNILQNAIALGDIDNDTKHELVVGNTNGELGVFKYNSLLLRTSGLGMIAAITIGDITNCGSNSLVVISGEGFCRIFNLPPEKNKLKLVHEQRIPANTKVAVLADIDSDGKVELIVGLTDRVVRSYRWTPGGSSSEEASSDSGGRLLGLHKWECASQIGSVTVNFEDDGSPCLLVAQPGGTRMKIKCSKSELEAAGQSEFTVDYHPLSRNRMRNPDISTEILGGIRPPVFKDQKNTQGTRYAIATLDGTLMLLQNDNIIWSFQVDHQVFALRTLCDADSDGDVLVACAWDGQTYFLDQERRSVRFQFEETVCGFTAGEYSALPGQNSGLCLVYTTFSQKIYVYYNVKIPSMVISQFKPKQLLHVTDNEERRKIVSKALYGET